MVCRYLNERWWGMSIKCQAGQSIEPSDECKKEYCYSEGNYTNCQRYKDAMSIDNPTPDIKSYVDSEIRKVNSSIEKVNEQVKQVKTRLKIISMFVLLALSISIYGVFLFTMPDVASQWWVIVVLVIINLISGTAINFLIEF